MSAAIDTGCRQCGTPWPDPQLIYRQPDGTWRTTCVTCGTQQEWSWVSRVPSEPGPPG